MNKTAPIEAIQISILRWKKVWIPAISGMTLRRYDYIWKVAMLALMMLPCISQASPNNKLPTEHTKYVYIKSNKVNLRAGPDFQYPIKWIISNRGEPMKVLGKFYQWINLEDINGNRGWLQAPMVSTRRSYGIVTNQTKRPIIGFATDSSRSRKIVKLEPGARLQVLKCKQSNWCKVKANNLKAWIPRENLWGVNVVD